MLILFVSNVVIIQADAIFNGVLGLPGHSASGKVVISLDHESSNMCAFYLDLIIVSY
jgi:hypothetical protein